MSTARLRAFVADFTALIDQPPDEPRVVSEGSKLLAALVAQDDWLPQTAAIPHPEHYSQYLLHLDPAGRFSMVSFVWGPGQFTPIHDHTVWGLIGMLRGSEISQRFRFEDGRPVADGAPQTLVPGDLEAVSPAVGDLHRVSNVFSDRASISVHLYGADIGAVSRHTYSLDGTAFPFISGYSNAGRPNLLADVPA